MNFEHLFQSRRELGKTGFMATQLGIGDIADRALPVETLVQTLQRALDAGLNVIDTATSYENGYSEEIVGKAIAGRRDRVFLVDKIDDHEAPVQPQIEASLKRLDVSYTDAFVFHGLSSMEVFERLCKSGAGFEQLQWAIDKGLTRFRGISSHHPDVLRAAIIEDLCDIVLFPVGPFVDPRYIHEILPLAKSRRVGTICFKTFGAGKLLGDTVGYNQPLQMRPRGKLSSGGVLEPQTVLPCLTVKECLSYTLTLDPDVTLLGLSFANEQDAAFAAAREFKPLPQEEMERIRVKALEARRHKGPCWWNPDAEA